MYESLKRTGVATSLAELGEVIGVGGSDATKRAKYVNDILRSRRKVSIKSAEKICEIANFLPLERLIFLAFVESCYARSAEQRISSLKKFSDLRRLIPRPWSLTDSPPPVVQSMAMRILSAFGPAGTSKILDSHKLTEIFGDANSELVAKTLNFLYRAGYLSKKDEGYRREDISHFICDYETHRLRLSDAESALNEWLHRPQESLFFTANLAVSNEDIPKLVAAIRQQLFAILCNASQLHVGNQIMDFNLTLAPVSRRHSVDTKVEE